MMHRQRSIGLVEAGALAAALDSSADHVALLDVQGTIVWANRAWADFLGLPSEDVTGRSLWSVATSAGSNPASADVLSDLLTSGRPLVVEALGLGAHGPRNMEYVLTPLPAGSREAAPDGAAILVVGRDVTARRQHVSALQESEEFFRLTFEHGPLGILILSPDRRVLRVNHRFAEALGYQPEELGARPEDALTHADDLERERPLLDRVQRGEIAAYRFSTR